MIPQVKRAETDAFARVWRHKGVAIPMLDVHIQFATDFANVVLRSFIENAQRQAMKAAEAAKIVSTD